MISLKDKKKEIMKKQRKDHTNQLKRKSSENNLNSGEKKIKKESVEDNSKPYVDLCVSSTSGEESSENNDVVFLKETSPQIKREQNVKQEHDLLPFSSEESELGQAERAQEVSRQVVFDLHKSLREKYPITNRPIQQHSILIAKRIPPKAKRHNTGEFIPFVGRVHATLSSLNNFVWIELNHGRLYGNKFDTKKKYYETVYHDDSTVVTDVWGCTDEEHGLAALKEQQRVGNSFYWNRLSHN